MIFATSHYGWYTSEDAGEWEAVLLWMVKAKGTCVRVQWYMKTFRVTGIPLRLSSSSSQIHVNIQSGMRGTQWSGMLNGSYLVSLVSDGTPLCSIVVEEIRESRQASSVS